ncbi:AAA family ATPase [Burkholderia cenocepacia]|uniref:AAA family ATPase n=1 Tax=Burkholderia cenocepacia TaxID=95486 RepID=UPI000760BE47|nr:AAA family ATPase [Burkholderia cenocepacia]KWU19047.1 hypothetical protein AS149_12430 [Burkholderia cenocepacia]
MFESISLAGLSKSQRFGYAAKLDFFKSRRKIQFKPGLNILFGPNGCGKSTLLRVLGETMCAIQGGTSIITERAVRDTVEFHHRKVADSIGLSVRHDGQPVTFCDPRNAVGLDMGAFDDDFMDMGLRNLLGGKKASHGQTTAMRGDKALGILMGKASPPSKVENRLSSGVNSSWKSALEIVQQRMMATIDLGQHTILLDEPEANFSILWQHAVWKLLGDPKVAETYQIIVASHSVFALGIPHAHYIDLKPGYVDEATVALKVKVALMDLAEPRGTKTGRISSKTRTTANTPKGD